MYPGVYKAKYLSSDSLGNVQVLIPQVMGNVPVAASSVTINSNNPPAPGALGWVVFEGGDPSLPVWLGAAGIDQTYWNRPWGVLAEFATTSLTFSSPSNGVTGYVPGFIGTVSTPAGRLIKTSCMIGSITHNATIAELTISDGVSSSQKAGTHVSLSGGSHYVDMVDVTVGPTLSRKAGIVSDGVASISVNGSFAANFKMEDIGPAVIGHVQAGMPLLTFPSNTAFGVLDWKAGFHSGTNTPVFTSAFASTVHLYEFDNFTMQAGRRYAIRFSSRAANPGAYCTLYKDGVYVTDTYGGRDSGAPSFGSINYAWELNGNDHPGTHTWIIGASSVSNTVTGTIYTNGDSASFSDIGSQYGPIVTVPAPTVTVPSGWLNVSGAGHAAFQNSWSNYTIGWAQANYRLNGDRVEIVGLVAGGTPDSTVFTLPVGMRPTEGHVMFAVPMQQSLNGTGRLDVQSDGQVVMRASPQTGTGASVYADITCSFPIL
jgi:hypothetical protein